jgi:hypothetical protein
MNDMLSGHHPPPYFYFRHASPSGHKGTSSTARAQIIKASYLKTEAESSIRNIALNKNRAVDNVHTDFFKNILILLSSRLHFRSSK